jgi:sec-independent protein translocase protein TatA
MKIEDYGRSFLHKHYCKIKFSIVVTELIIVLVILVVLFGASRLPEIGSGIGEAIKNLKKSMSELHEIDVTPKIKYDRILTI